MGDVLLPEDSQPLSMQENPRSDDQERDLIKIARGGGIAFIGTVATRVLGYAYTVVLIWGLGGENFGLFTLSLALINFMGILAQVGLDRGIIRFGSLRSSGGKQANIHKVTLIALRISIPIGFLFLAALFATADSIAQAVFHKPELGSLIRVLTLIIPLVSAQTMLMSATQARKLVGYSAIVLIVQNLAALIFAGGLLAFNLGLQAVVLSLVMSYVLGTILALYFYLRLISRNADDADSIGAGQIIKFSIPLSMTQWIHFANERTELFFLGMLPRVIEVGIYNVAWRLAGLETIFSESLNQIFAPFSSDLSHRHEIKQLEDLYQTTAKWSFTGALIIFLLFSLFSVPIMRVFDPAFVVGSNVLIALGFAQLISALTGSCGTVLIMSGRSDLSLMNTIILLVSSIVLDWLLIPTYGLLGAAIAGPVTVIFINLLRLVEVWWTLKIHPFKATIYKPILAGAASFGLVYILRRVISPESLWLDFIYSLVFVAAYVVIVYLLKVDQDDGLVLGVVRRKFLGARAASQTSPQAEPVDQKND